jgi:methionyl-tRNA synthetase
VSDSFYITTPIYYVNDAPHVGHTYTTVVADALARYHRARGQDTRFLTGTDEHGEKIETTAAAHGMGPKEWADKTVVRFHEAWRRMDIANDDFIRTTDARHEAFVAEMWKRLEAAGDIYLGHYEGLYCVGCEAFYTEGQLEQPGNICPQHKKPVGLVKEPSYFFKMAKYQDRLLAHIDANPDFIVPEVRRNEVVAFVKSGLRDLSVSRTSFKWGIPVPGDPKHIIYVWIDALTNYMSALGEPGSDLYERFWRNAVHLIGKDIVRFHAVYWPTMLMSAGLPLPKTILTHGWWTVRGQKISKGLPATKVDPLKLADDIGPDALRYFLLREIPLGLDGDFSYEALIGRINSDLANDLGNLLNRMLPLVEKNAGGVVPAARPELDAAGANAEIAALAARCKAEAERQFEAFAPSRALEAIFEFIRGANRYVNDVLQDKGMRQDPARRGELEHFLHTALEAIAWAGWMVAPVMPRKAGELFEQLGLGAETARRWPQRWNHELPAGGKIAKGAVLFPRLDEARQAELLDKWIPPEARKDTEPGVPTAQTAPAAKPAAKDVDKTDKMVMSNEKMGLIAYEDFAKLDLRVATVVAAEKVPKTDKLLKLQLDVGGENRQVVAGVAETYAPDALIGKKVIFLANLAPREMRGVESQGMILAAGEKQVLALSALDKDVPSGTKVK